MTALYLSVIVALGLAIGCRADFRPYDSSTSWNVAAGQIPPAEVARVRLYRTPAGDEMPSPGWITAATPLIDWRGQTKETRELLAVLSERGGRRPPATFVRGCVQFVLIVDFVNLPPAYVQVVVQPSWAMLDPFGGGNTEWSESLASWVERTVGSPLCPAGVGK